MRYRRRGDSGLAGSVIGVIDVAVGVIDMAGIDMAGDEGGNNFGRRLNQAATEAAVGTAADLAAPDAVMPTPRKES
jgi:hypothetical protein